MSNLNSLIEEIDKLQPVDRVKLVNIVMRETIKPNPEIEEIWAQESSIRWQAYKNGEVEPVTYDEVMSKYNKS